LTPADFSRADVNQPSLIMSDRMLDRLGYKKLEYPVDDANASRPEG